jgi:hypothetical protein
MGRLGKITGNKHENLSGKIGQTGYRAEGAAKLKEIDEI